MTSKFNLPVRKLLGPGPANVDPRVMEAIHAPAIGHMDPAFMEVLAETADRSPRKYTELSRQKDLMENDAWPHIVLSAGRLYCKDRDGNMKCFTLKP